MLGNGSTSRVLRMTLLGESLQGKARGLAVHIGWVRPCFTFAADRLESMIGTLLLWLILTIYIGT